MSAGGITDRYHDCFRATTHLLMLLHLCCARRTHSNRNQRLLKPQCVNRLSTSHERVLDQKSSVLDLLANSQMLVFISVLIVAKLFVKLTSYTGKLGQMAITAVLLRDLAVELFEPGLYSQTRSSGPSKHVSSLSNF